MGVLPEQILKPLRALHPPDGGYITFHAPVGDNPVGFVTALRPRDLGSLFPDFINSLVRDSYFSINGMHQPWRNAKLVANINAVWLDIDYHDHCDPSDAAAAGLARIMTLAVTGEIPEPTIYVRSGRGFWTFWRLREADGRALSARGNRATWARLGRGIADCVRAFGFPVDGNALTIERLTRMPESVNSNTESKVAYTVNYNHGGEPVSYTLLELARLFNVPETSTLPAPPVIKPVQRTLFPIPSSPRRNNSGQRALRLRRLNDLETLMELRGGRFKEGCRNYAAVLFAAFERGNPKRETLVGNFCRDRCAPPLKPCEVRAALKTSSRPRFKITDLKIGQWLKITATEAMNLEGGDKYLTVRTPYQLRLPLKQGRRRELISEICGRGRLSLRAIQASLRDAEHGGSLETIRSDLEVLGIKPGGCHIDQPVLNVRLL